MALSALTVSSGFFSSCTSASKSASSKTPGEVVRERRAAEETVTVSEPLTSAIKDISHDHIDSFLPLIPNVSSIDISHLPESLPLPAGVAEADSLRMLFASSLPDSLYSFSDIILTTPVDSLSSVIDSFPEDFKALIPEELSLLISRVGDGTTRTDSVRRRVAATYRERVPDSLKGLSDDSLRSYAASLGVPLSDWMDDYPDDVVIETGALTIMGDGSEDRDRAFLDHPVFGTNRDSLVYDVKNRLIFVYGDGDLTYEDNNLIADFMILNSNTKEIYGTGVPDSLGVMSRPEFTQAGGQYTMDTITYNLDSGKAKIKGVATKDGEGYLLGRDIKKMPDNTINLAHGKYTTCDHVDHPHFYIAMTKAKVIPGKKIITGPAYFVMEDVPLYFLGIPGGFFPISSGPQAGFIMPTYGEESRRGFYLRDGGYYFTFGDYADLALTGGIYTLGSWELAARSNYILRYKFSGNLNINYAKTILGEKNSADYQNSSNFKIAWTHRQDPKFRPNSTFSASVNFSTSGYNKQGTTSVSDYLNTQTNSSISYSKSWTAGTTPINLTASFSHSQNSRDSTISLTLPNISFSVGSFSPFKRRQAVGKQRWYEKVQVSYAMAMQNSFSGKERDMFTDEMWQNLRNGISHKIPVKTSFNFLGFISFSPSFNYNEVWNFKKERYAWDPVEEKRVELDPEFGFYRIYNYNVSGSFSTKLYGEFRIKRKPGKVGWLQGVRHVMTPTVGFTYAPDFTQARYGFQEFYQNSIDGTTVGYNPYRNNSPTLSAAGPSASINFSLSNQIEMKVTSKTDTSGVKKIPLIEQLSASGSWNFLAPGDSMHLSTISLTLRTGNIVKNFGIQLNAVWDPYVVLESATGSPIRTGKYNIGNGKFGRIASTSWSFGYTFNSSNSGQPVINDINSGAYVGAYTNPFDMDYQLEPHLRRQYMTAAYYDFNIPWNFGFNYSVSYTNNGLRTTTTQTLGFNGSVTLTQKWGVTFNGGFDIARRSFTPGTISLTRDLHCWAMTFQWVPIGTLKSWSFHIGVKSSMLADLKYDKSSSRYDNLQE